MTAAREVVGWPVGPGVLADAESTAVGAASGELPVSALLSPRGRLARDPPPLAQPWPARDARAAGRNQATALSRASLKGGSASALPVSRPAQRSLRVAACVLAESPTGDPSPSECFSPIRYLLAPLRLLPAGATVAGRDSHPLGHSAFPRRTQVAGYPTRSGSPPRTQRSRASSSHGRSSAVFPRPLAFHRLTPPRRRRRLSPPRNLLRAVAGLVQSRAPVDLLPVVAALQGWLQDSRAAEAFTDWIRQMAERLVPTGAELPPLRMLEEARMTLVERVGEWPEQ